MESLGSMRQWWMMRKGKKMKMILEFWNHLGGDCEEECPWRTYQQKNQNSTKKVMAVIAVQQDEMGSAGGSKFGIDQSEDRIERWDDE